MLKSLKSGAAHRRWLLHLAMHCLHPVFLLYSAKVSEGAHRHELVESTNVHRHFLVPKELKEAGVP